jgi:hypothetical protein
VTGAVAAGIPAAAAPVACAGEIVGSALASAPDATVVMRTGFIDMPSAQPAGVMLPLAASSAGVITAIRIRHAGTGSAPGSLRFRIVSGASAGALTARVAVRLPDLPLAPNAPGAVLTVIPHDLGGIPHGVPVAAGERLALATVGATAGQEIRPFANVAGAGVFYRDGWQDGLAQPYLEATGLELLVQVSIEPDGDGDGYGDDTQDHCLADSSGPCVTPSTCRVPRVTGVSVAVARRLLAVAGCRLGKVTRRRGAGATRVVAQSVRVGRMVVRGTRVSVTLRVQQ